MRSGRELRDCQECQESVKHEAVFPTHDGAAEKPSGEFYEAGDENKSEKEGQEGADCLH